MPDRSSSLDELDARLRAVQAELEADLGASSAEPPTLAPVPPSAPTRAPTPPRSRATELMSARLVGAARELLAGYELALASTEEVTLTVGPFTATAALERFETELRGLPGVASVHRRGFDGRQRAIVEVHLQGDR